MSTIAKILHQHLEPTTPNPITADSPAARPLTTAFIAYF